MPNTLLYRRYTFIRLFIKGAESLTKTIESVASSIYPAQRRLLFVICDGMIMGSGNDKPTPLIVLDILGADKSIDPPTLAYESLGENDLKINMAKVYCGIYKCKGKLFFTSGNSIPYIVIVKVGKRNEYSKPGNRGKRDSQLILMRFLSRVHFCASMSPLELELFRTMKNIIGIHPSNYEFLLQIDADTILLPTSVNKLVSSMIHDSKIAGLCGETLISNEKQSWVTMIQVYEYFISHHLSKSFESLFGAVTCLPGFLYVLSKVVFQCTGFELPSVHRFLFPLI